MQVHLNGYEGSQDPLWLQFKGKEEPDYQTQLPEEVDVLIVGAGPAGHLLATQLSRFPNITTRLVEARNRRLENGYADGLQCRTVEIFEAFGFADQVLKEGYWVNETCFWSPTEDGKGIHRTGRIPDTERGLSEQPHIILNQARLQDLWRECMKKSPTRLEPTYGRRVVNVKPPARDDAPIEVTLERTDERNKGHKEYVRAKYVVGCDGARSAVRETLGWRLKGDSSNQAWGVLDALVSTDFPDLRIKTAIHSADDGSLLIIPREGGYLSRLYVELDKLQQDERIKTKNITSDMIVERAQRIFKPYRFEVREVPHFTVYEVGQRLTDHFDDVPVSERGMRTARIFTAGDACHTHSAKAGQGMNVSMNDTYNLGWKLAAVLNGTASPKLLNTYSTERHAIAQRLIDFDREWSAMFAAKPQLNAATTDTAHVDPAAFQAAYQRFQRFTAGVETCYPPSIITSSITQHQHLAKGFEIGTRFHSLPALRLADAKSMQLGHVLRADGRWRIFLFGDNGTTTTNNNDSPNPFAPNTPLTTFCAFLATHLIPRYTPADTDPDAILDVRALLQQSRRTLDITTFPPLLLPQKGKLQLIDYEKVFTDEESYAGTFGDVFSARDIDRQRGCVVVVRPDQYVSAVLPLSDEGQGALREFFDGFMNVIR